MPYIHGEKCLAVYGSDREKPGIIHTHFPTLTHYRTDQTGFFLTSETHAMCFVASRKIDENDNFLYSLEFFDPNMTNDMAVIRFLLSFAKMPLADQHHKLIERFSKVISHGEYADEVWAAHRVGSPPLAPDAQQKAEQKTIYHGDAPLEKKFYQCIRDGNAAELRNVLDAIDKADENRSEQDHQDTPLLFNLVLWKSALGTTGVWLAMQHNHVEALDVFLKAEGFKKLTPDQQQRIFMAKNRSGAPGLSVAMENGHSAILQTLLDSSFFKGLSMEQQMQILMAKDGLGIPGLHVAMQNGHSAILQTLLDSCFFKELSMEQQQMQILMAKKELGTPGLYVAMQNGHSAILQTLLDSSVFKGLSMEQQMQILMAKKELGRPGLFVAMQNGHSAILQTLLDSCFFKELSTEQQIQIIGCKNISDELNGLAAALYFGKMNIFETLFTHWPGLKQISFEQKQEVFLPLSKLINIKHGVKIKENGYLDELKELLNKHDINIKI